MWWRAPTPPPPESITASTFSHFYLSFIDIFSFILSLFLSYIILITSQILLKLIHGEDTSDIFSLLSSIARKLVLRQEQRRKEDGMDTMTHDLSISSEKTAASPRKDSLRLSPTKRCRPSENPQSKLGTEISQSKSVISLSQSQSGRSLSQSKNRQRSLVSTPFSKYAIPPPETFETLQLQPFDRSDYGLLSDMCNLPHLRSPSNSTSNPKYISHACQNVLQSLPSVNTMNVGVFSLLLKESSKEKQEDQDEFAKLVSSRIAGQEVVKVEIAALRHRLSALRELFIDTERSRDEQLGDLDDTRNEILLSSQTLSQSTTQSTVQSNSQSITQSTTQLTSQSSSHPASMILEKPSVAIDSITDQHKKLSLNHYKHGMHGTGSVLKAQKLRPKASVIERMRLSEIEDTIKEDRVEWMKNSDGALEIERQDRPSFMEARSLATMALTHMTR